MSITFRRFIAIREAGIVIAVATVYLAFTIISPSYFPTYSNMLTIIRLAIQLGIAGVGITMVLTCGEIDLSIGSAFALTGMFLAVMYENLGVDIWVATILTLALGAFLGWVNGFTVTRTRLPAFIVTLATMLIYKSLALLVTQGYPALFHQPPIYQIMFGGELPGRFPTSAIWLAGVAILFFVILGKTRFGNWTSATGDKPWAAIAAGVDIKRVKVINFVLLSTLIALASVLNVSRLTTASPLAGDLLLFEGIGASVIGGTSLFGGSGTIVGAVLGAILIAEIENGLAILGVGAFVFGGAVGAVIFLASVVNVIIQKRREKAL